MPKKPITRAFSPFARERISAQRRIQPKGPLPAAIHRQAREGAYTYDPSGYKGENQMPKLPDMNLKEAAAKTARAAEAVIAPMNVVRRKLEKHLKK